MADNSADTATTPATETGFGATSTSAATPVTPTIDLNAVLAENRRLVEERDKLTNQNREVRKWATQSSQKAAQLEREMQARAETFGDPAQTSTQTYDNEVLADIAEVKFKQNTPDWNKVVDKQSGKTVWDEMNSIIFDDAKVSELVGRTPYLTLKNVYKEVQLQRLLADQKAQASQPRRSVMQAQAEMSGQGANTPIPSIDISDPNMTEGQFLDAANKAGLLDDLIDPNDPPSFFRK